MRLYILLFATTIVATAAPSRAQDALPSCASLVSSSEIQSTCGVSDFTFETSPDRESGCQISAQRNGAVSALVITLAVQDNAAAAQASVEVARAIGLTSDDSRATAGDTGQAGEALGQVFEVLGVQDESAAAAPGVSDAEAASRDLPDLGEGGVRYVSDATAGMGLITHTVVFSSGATLVKMESGIAADRAGVCTVDTLEPLARLIANRL